MCAARAQQTIHVSGNLRNDCSLTARHAGEYITAHIGITAPNFPNFFICQGPGTGLAHGGSAIFTSECQIRYITGCIAEIIDRDNERSAREREGSRHKDPRDAR